MLMNENKVSLKIKNNECSFTEGNNIDMQYDDVRLL